MDEARDFPRAGAYVTGQTRTSALKLDLDGELLALHGFQVEVGLRPGPGVLVIGCLELDFVREERIDAVAAFDPGEREGATR
ncbi:hypothetical protein D9M68_264520 [compost metagenome]